MTSSRTITSLARAAASPLRTQQQQQHAQRRLLHQICGNIVRPRHAGRLGIVATAACQIAPRAAALAVARTPAQAQARTYFSQDAAPPAVGPSKIWGFEEIQKLVEDPKRKVVLVDTREPGELQQTGRIPGAINIPITTSPDSFHITEEDFEDRFGYPRPDRDAEVVFYCKAGVRSRAAAGLAKNAGWTNVGEYPGSWLDWAEKGGKSEKA